MGVRKTNSTLRELIPRSNSGKVDESAPLSASDVITLLDNIRARSEGIKEKVQRTVTNYHEEFLRIITQSSKTIVHVENVAEQLKNVLELLGEKDVALVSDGSNKHIFAYEKSSSGKFGENHQAAAEVGTGPGEEINLRPVDLEICHLAAEVQGLRSKVKENEKALVVVETISSLHGLLLAAERKFLPGQLVEAAREMVFLQEKLGLTDVNHDTGAKGHDVRVFKLLQNEWSDRYNKLLRLLDGLVSKAIVLDERKSELSVLQHIESDTLEVGSDAGAVDLSSILSAMDVLGVLDVRLAKFGDAIVKHILSPLLKNSQSVVSTLVLGSGAGSTPRSVLKWSFGTQQNAEPVLEILYPKIVQVIKFLNDHILGNYDGRMTRFGRMVWPRLADAIIAGCLSKAVPNETSQLKDFEHIAEVTTNFERELAYEGLIANFDPAKGDKLSTFASDVEVHFASKKKKNVLAKVRSLLMQSDYSLLKSKWTNSKDEVSETDLGRSIYHFPDPCAISLLARSLMEIVHDTLEDVCLSTPRTALELYHASRDAILMYRAIIPLKLVARSDKLQVAALCYNDCRYIAHEVLTFKYQYQEELPSSLKPLFTLVDLAPLFRKMAEEVLDSEIKVIESHVTKALDLANGFQFTDVEKNFQLAQQSLEQVFAIFANVGQQLRPVLAHKNYSKVMGRLINVAAGRIISEVLAMKDIGVQETVQLQKLLCILQDRCPVLLSPAVVDVSAKERIKEEEVENVVPVWQKLKTLTKVLDMSLVSINQAWESGDLSSAGFVPSEVQRLVRAIFSATPLREECLLRIASSSR